LSDAVHYEVIIAGGGAAGVFAALACAQANRATRVLVLERGSELLAKVRISGGGRCNVTHACFEPQELAQNYPRGGRELIGPFHSWQPRDTVDWFESRGVKLKTEGDGRMFPVTDSSQTIIDCLLHTARKLKIEFRTKTGLVDAHKAEDGRFHLGLSDGSKVQCERLLIAAGGLKPGPLLDLVRKFGHTIEPLAPSLFTFHVRDPRIDGLQGVSVNVATVSLPGTKFQQSGPVLITHSGLSGPAIIKLSAWGARWAQEKNYHFPCAINWAAGFEPDHAKAELERLRQGNASRLTRKIAPFQIPMRLWERLVSAAGVQEDLPGSQLRREQLQSLVTQLTRSEFQVSGKSMFKEEFVTAGGVSLKEINFKRMESRLVPGLFFAGEVLDIDGITGGFNFQSAWTTGYLAGGAMGSFP
jgi:predicted Rossmann fold flavoprotein